MPKYHPPASIASSLQHMLDWVTHDVPDKSRVPHFEEPIAEMIDGWLRQNNYRHVLSTCTMRDFRTWARNYLTTGSASRSPSLREDT